MKKVLLVEDNEVLRENLAEILELEGYQALMSENGEAGLAAARIQTPDLILSDIDMPIMDGYQFLNSVKKDKILSGIPFVFLSVKNNAEERVYGLGLGADDYLSKPFKLNELLGTLSKHLR